MLSDVRAGRLEYLPTRRQIRTECEAIRSRWTPAELRRRSTSGVLAPAAVSWSPPCIATSQCLSRVRKFVAEASV